MHKVTSKRQVTLPQSVCKALSLEAGDYVEVFERDNVAHIVKISDEDLSGKFHHLLKGQSFPSPDAINEALKKRAAKKFASHDSD